MLTNGTKRLIDTARDILVGKLPDPKSQVEQITIALIYKFMDDIDKQSEELGGKAKFFTGEYAKYSWNSIMNPRVGGHELVGLYGEGIQKMNQNPNIPPLFRDMFKNAYLPYRDPETLKSFLKTIGEFKYDHSENLGVAYEYLLSVMGSQGDAGQFRTPRHIIDFIVKVIDPKINETILDPACGTAGFLISSYKHILEKHHKEGRLNLQPNQRKRLLENIEGYDISPDMVRLSLVNMYLHNFNNPKIYEYDTLTSEEKWNDKFDVIMANPPFMSPKGGIRPHRRFSVQSNRSEVLFVDYIAEHLNSNGRAGIIVPEGVIFQAGKAYKQLRKMLLDNSLYAVVSLPAGVFNPYSGVKTSILLMDKKIAKKCNDVLFVKVSADGYNLGAQRREIKENDLPLALEVLKEFQTSALEGVEPKLENFERVIAHIVSKDKIAEQDYNLSGDRYKEEVVYDGNWDLVELGEVVLEMKDGGTPPRKDSDNFGGNINWCVVKDIKSEIWNTKECLSEKGLKNSSAQVWPIDSVIISLGATIGNVGIAKVPTATKQGLSGIVVDKSKILSKFLYSILIAKKEYIQSLATGASIKEVRPSKLLRLLKIPLPPLEVQERIVEEIESYQNIIDGAKKVVESYKPSFKIESDWDVVELGEACDVRDGTHDSPQYVHEGYPLVTSKNVKDGTIDFTNVSYVSKEDFDNINKRSLVEDGDIIMPMIGTIGSPIVVKKEREFAIKNVALIKFKDNNRANNYFINYVLSSELFETYIEKVSRGGTQKFISLKNIRTFKTPLPPIETQKEIVAKIEEEQKLVDSNKQLIEIFENKIKDKIAEVWGE
jgi:type I restriction enzyme M protein